MSGLNALIADDETPITSILCSRLQRAGFEVRVAADGQEAFALAQKLTPDVVVTDLQMPRWSGLEFAQAMSREPDLRHVPVLLLTARGYIISDEERKTTNIRAIMPKPFSANEVVRRVLELLGSAHESHQRESA